MNWKRAHNLHFCGQIISDKRVKNINENQGYVKAMWCGDQECEDKIKELTGAHSRCIPFEKEHISDKCVCCGKEAKEFVIWGRQY